MSIQQLDQSVNRFGTTKVGDFLNSHTSPDGSQLIDDPDIPTGTIEITENGEYDVTQYASADVNVAQDFTVWEDYSVEGGTLYSGNIEIQGVVVANIPDGVITIGGAAFAHNDLINKVIMPNSVTTISSPAGDTGAFYQCTQLIDVVFSNTLSNIGNNCFYGCVNLEINTIPSSITTIGISAFKDCASLTNFVIPDGVTTIDSMAFSNSGLTTITFPNSVTSIGNGVCSLCTELTEVYLGIGITNIPYGAFGGCESLTDIYYSGTQSQWEQITISGEAIPAGATIHYEYTPE